MINLKRKESVMLERGDIFKIEKGHSFYVKELPQLFLCDNGDYNWENSSGEIRNVGQIQRGLDTNVFVGEYIVEGTSSCGGGTGHGAHDVYPNGHKVTAKRIVERFGKKEVSDFEISFYQSGSFTCMNPDIEAIRKAELKYHI